MFCAVISDLLGSKFLIIPAEFVALDVDDEGSCSTIPNKDIFIP